MADFTENDLRDIERARDLPPDEPYPRSEGDEVFSDAESPVIVSPYQEARSYLQDAWTYLAEPDIDPEEAIRCAEEAVARIRAAL